MLHMCFLKVASKKWWISVKNLHNKISCDKKTRTRETNIWATEQNLLDSIESWLFNKDPYLYNGPLLTITI